MYLPAHFAEPRVEELHRIVRTYPLGMLVTHSVKGIDADHLPFEFDADRGAHGTLVAHIARANPLWSEIGDGAEVMVVLLEPQRGHAITSSCKRRVKRTTCELLVLWQFGGAMP
jgi:predicted FMN-binding regulatory protein PaiB